MYVGKRIKQLRQHLNLNQTEFATELGVSQAYYSGIESGKKKISRKMLEGIYLKWPISQIILDGKFPVDVSKMGGKDGGYVEGVYNKLPYEEKLKFFKEYIKSTGNQRLIFLQKFNEDLKQERPDLADLLYLFSQLAAFSIDLENIYLKYIDPIFSGVSHTETKNYSDYKKKSIKHLEQFIKFKDAFKPIVKDLKKLVEVDFPPLDTKGVLLPDEDEPNNETSGVK